MSIVVPPAPSHESASAVMARLARLSQGGPSEEKGEQAARRPRMLLVMSCLLCACGIFLLICTLGGHVHARYPIVPGRLPHLRNVVLRESARP